MSRLRVTRACRILLSYCGGNTLTFESGRRVVARGLVTVWNLLGLVLRRVTTCVVTVVRAGQTGNRGLWGVTRLTRQSPLRLSGMIVVLISSGILLLCSRSDLLRNGSEVRKLAVYKTALNLFEALLEKRIAAFLKCLTLGCIETWLRRT